LELALAKREVETTQMLSHGLAFGLPLQPFLLATRRLLDDRQLLGGRGLFKMMAVFGYHALLVVTVDDSVEFGLESAYLGEFCIWRSLAKKQLIPVDVEKS
jgi:hypothetical protein